MNQFKDMTYSGLLDMLASYTTLYTQMLTDNNRNAEFYECKRTIELLAAEIELRRNSTRPANKNPQSFPPQRD